jgi:transcriptional regulator with XRE-family HTH domain
VAQHARSPSPGDEWRPESGILPHDSDSETLLGSEVRELRKARDLTLKDVADRSGLSVGYLSQIERDLATPSIKALHDIARVLGVNISWFFPPSDGGTEGERRFIVRGDRRRTLNFGSGITDHLLCPSLSGDLELLSSTFAPGASSGEEPYTHRGEEAGVIISGELDLWIDDEEFHLNTGDSFNFPSTTPHRYRNPGETETVVIWAITPPTY